MRSVSMPYPPVLMRMNSTEIPERSRTAFTWAIARKNQEFTFTRISAWAPRSNGKVVSMFSMEHPPRPKSRILPLSSLPCKGKLAIWA
jgi:hypothetical protein